MYDGQGFWLCHKRLSSGRFRWRPNGQAESAAGQTLAVHQLQVLLWARDPNGSRAVGEHLKYLVFAGRQPIACLAWSSPPRHLGCRDRFIGWSAEDRRRRRSQEALHAPGSLHVSDATEIWHYAPGQLPKGPFPVLGLFSAPPSNLPIFLGTDFFHRNNLKVEFDYRSPASALAELDTIWKWMALISRIFRTPSR
jgi:hypothetical protein